MPSVKEQIHGKFKMFVGDLDAEKKPGALTKEVESFVASAKVAPKSIGLEYLEGDKKLVLTLGYRDDEAGYPVSLKVTSLGKAASLGPSGLKKLEKKLSDAAASTKGIICHELYVTEDKEFLVVFMTLA